MTRWANVFNGSAVISLHFYENERNKPNKPVSIVTEIMSQIESASRKDHLNEVSISFETIVQVTTIYKFLV